MMRSAHNNVRNQKNKMAKSSSSLFVNTSASNALDSSFHRLLFHDSCEGFDLRPCFVSLTVLPCSLFPLQLDYPVVSVSTSAQQQQSKSSSRIQNNILRKLWTKWSSVN